MTEKQKITLYDTVNDFIKRIHEKDLVITKEAATIQFSNPSATGVRSVLGIRKKTGNLADRLAWAMSAYEGLKENTQLCSKYAAECLMWINRAYAWDVIKEGKGLINKVKKAEEKIAVLEADNIDLSAKLLTLKNKYEELSDSGDEFYGNHVKPT
jgi:hypothetical protein